MYLGCYHCRTDTVRPGLVFFRMVSIFLAYFALRILRINSTYFVVNSNKYAHISNRPSLGLSSAFFLDFFA